MKKLLPVLMMVFGVFLGSAGETLFSAAQAQTRSEYLTGNQIRHLFDGSKVRVGGDCVAAYGTQSGPTTYSDFTADFELDLT